MMISVLRSAWLGGRLYIANHVIAHVPFHFIRLSFYRVIMKAKIGSGSSIFMGAWFDTPGGLSIGSNSTINQNCRLDSRGKISIGNNVSISADVCILTAEHDVQSPGFRGLEEAVLVEDFVFIGTRAMILPGVILGIGSVVAAGAVVTKNVEPYTIVGGVPARSLGSRISNLSYNVHYRRFLH